MSVYSLERWRAGAQIAPARERAWSASEGFSAVTATAATVEAKRSAWCRENSRFSQELVAWRASASQALAEPAKQRASPRETAADRRRKEKLERKVLRKNNALAEEAALLVLKKKLEAIFHKAEDISIKELELLRKVVVGYACDLTFDTSKPDGAPPKLLNVSRVHATDARGEMTLSYGVHSTYQWFLANHHGARA